MPRPKATLTSGRNSIHNRGAITKFKPKPKAKPTRKPPPAPPQPEYAIKYWPAENLICFKNYAEWDETKLNDTGYGSRLTDAAISRFTAACPNLVHIDMDSARDLTGARLLAMCRNCPNIEYISIDGNDKCKGHVGGTALDALSVVKKMAKGLRVLHLVDQGAGLEKEAKKLSKARKGLEITLGETKKWGNGSAEKFVGGKSNLNFGKGWDRYDGPRAFGSGWRFG
ncbi:hypothetical protein GLAREA_02356 [Glarea lozoyensis ATCC 20868]|uniref:Uncharacterized protein n=1 Tax=Glarea lozoyensis (strain ATCC 20868 / MF5171) TaxID=1116229 RepID=S3DIR3_GLAL2|nr:uncharacterized protein GLAREA_02356 [Glarea lozoyensis ATCC 20868]EPE26443.1 hypothetical protein GLAREA_02356 [Glarea lozoyensis ATCC 20868]